MASESMDLVPSQPRIENELNSQIGYQDDSLQYCGGGSPATASQHPASDHGRKPRPMMGGFIREKSFAIDQRERVFQMHGGELRCSTYDSPGHPPRKMPSNHDWNINGSTESASGDGTEDDDEDADEGDGEVDGLVVGDDANKNNNSSGSVQSSSDKIRKEKENLSKMHSSFGPTSRAVGKDNISLYPLNFRGSFSEQQQNQGRINSYDNSIGVIERDLYYDQMLHGQDSLTLSQKDGGVDNGCGNMRKDPTYPMESGDSLRRILSDPITGTLMDDAVILSCGHSFGVVGLQHVLKMKSCYICSEPVSEDSVSPNLALCSAVQAFRREEELQSLKASKRRRERFDQDKNCYYDPFSMDLSRGKGVQFPFAVADRVIIKGNKRTPQRFVGREAVVTTQCLNGWYVVKTLDNAESVKLQYRSLAKAPDNLSSNVNSGKPFRPNWL